MYKLCGFRTVPTHKTRFVPLPRIFDLFVDDCTSQAARVIIPFRWCLMPMRGVNAGLSPGGPSRDAHHDGDEMEETRWSVTRDHRHPSWSLTPTFTDSVVV